MDMPGLRIIDLRAIHHFYLTAGHIAAYVFLAIFLTGSFGEPTNASTVNPKTEQLKPQNLDDVFIFSLGGRKFDAQTWQQDPASRFGMLFDLYHMPLNEKTAEQIFDLLGQPTEISNGVLGGSSAFYDLDLKNGRTTLLAIWFSAGKVACLSIEQRAENGFSEIPDQPQWQTKNVSWNTIATEYNRKYYLVGMPVRLISVATGYRCTDTNTMDGECDTTALAERRLHNFGPFQFEYTSDNAKVKRFRIALAEQGCYTNWENQDLRTDARCLVRHSEYFNLESRPEQFLKPFLPFSKESWNSERNFNRRYSVLSSLVRTYPIIGMSHSDVTSLLGGAYNPTSNIEDYLLYTTGCGNAGVHYFELCYKNEHVVSYRIIYRPGESLGKRTRINGAPFGYL
jgi:hypothetical protein